MVRAWAFLLCAACEGGAVGRVHLAEDEAGRPRRWWGCSEIELMVDEKPGLSAESFRALEEAAFAWRDPALPSIRIRRGAASRSEEDGINTVRFVRPGASCARARRRTGAAFCLEQGARGVTRLDSRPRRASAPARFPPAIVASGDCAPRGAALMEEAEIVEADLLLDERLLEDPERLYAVLLHELGHVLGLGHADPSLAPGESIMTPVAPLSTRRPGKEDLRTLRVRYSTSCAR